jgi:putative effector of murein hydrolase
VAGPSIVRPRSSLVRCRVRAGVFAGIAMSLNALVTSLLVPVAVTLLVR